MIDLKDLSPEDREALRAQILEESESEAKGDFYEATHAKAKALMEQATNTLTREAKAIERAKTVSLNFFSKLSETIVRENLFDSNYQFQAAVNLEKLLRKTDDWSLPEYSEMHINVNDPEAYDDWKLLLTSAFGEGKRKAYQNQNIVLSWDEAITDLTGGKLKSIRWDSSLSIKLIASPEAHGCDLVEKEVLVPAKTYPAHTEIQFEISCR